MKKRMQTTVAVLLMAVLLTLTACGGGNTLSGKWQLSSIEADGFSMDLETMRGMGLDMDMYFEFQSGNQVKIVGDAFDEYNEEVFEYSYDGSKITITGPDGDTLEGTVNGSELVIEEDGMKMIFTKV